MQGRRPDSADVPKTGGGGSLQLTLLRPNSLLTGNNTGNFAKFGSLDLAVIEVSDSFCLASSSGREF
jgi:hypothetical protein